MRKVQRHDLLPSVFQRRTAVCMICMAHTLHTAARTTFIHTQVLQCRWHARLPQTCLLASVSLRSALADICCSGSPLIAPHCCARGHELRAALRCARKKLEDAAHLLGEPPPSDECF